MSIVSSGTPAGRGRFGRVIHPPSAGGDESGARRSSKWLDGGPMAIVRLRGQLKQLADGRAEVTVDGASVGDALRALERDVPALRGWILDERAQVRRHINVFVAG